ncbi:MAG: hypothetical protein J4G16_04345 [Acidobacteria bacterium]|nr:hypothetical protein [Acidobacteriota bacterium]
MRGTYLVAALTAMLVVPVLAAPAAAQDEAPRTPWGAPDLQGVWDFRTITPLQRPEELGEQEFLTEEEAASLEREAVERDIRLWEAEARRTEAGGSVGAYNNFWMDRGTNVAETRRTSLIIDPPNGRMPPLSDAGQQRAEARRVRRAEHPADSWLDRSSFDRCIPMTPGGYNQNMQLFQTEDHVVVLNEMVHDSRIIPIDGRPRPGIDSWTGESRGHWEGDTLVVETVDFSAKHSWRGTSPERHLIERFTRVDADTLLYEFTVTDPGTWTAPWTAQVPMRLNELPLFEYACHEGNYSLEGILSGTRADERKAAAAAQQESR